MLCHVYYSALCTIPQAIRMRSASGTCTAILLPSRLTVCGTYIRVCIGGSPDLLLRNLMGVPTFGFLNDLKKYTHVLFALQPQYLVMESRFSPGFLDVCSTTWDAQFAQKFLALRIFFFFAARWLASYYAVLIRIQCACFNSSWKLLYQYVFAYWQSVI